MKHKLIITAHFVSSFLLAQETQPRRPVNFVPYRYEYTVEQLQRLYSENIMKRAATERVLMEEAIKRGAYKADYD